MILDKKTACLRPNTNVLWLYPLS